MCNIGRSKYNSLSEWKKASPRGYANAIKFGILDKICNDFGWEIKKTKPFRYWNLEKILEECRKYPSLIELKKHNKSAIECARSRGLLDEIYKFYNLERKIQKRQHPSGYWTKEKCIESAKKYNSKVGWEKSEEKSAYSAANAKGWYKECTSHMVNKIKKTGYWTKEKCLEDALKYKTKEEWKKSYGANNSARRNGWMKECTKHMFQKNNSPGYWTKERCLKEAKKYKNRGEWSNKNQTSYNASRRIGCFELCVSHMKTREIKPHGYWTKEKCKEDALKYKQLKDWISNSLGAVASARKNGWISECCNHMIKYTHAKRRI